MPVPEARGTVERPLLRDTAYAKLCEAIVNGILLGGMLAVLGAIDAVAAPRILKRGWERPDK